MIYEINIGCDKTELILNTIWLKYCHLTDKHKRSSQLEIWMELLKAHAFEYPEFCQFVQLLIATL